MILTINNQIVIKKVPLLIQILKVENRRSTTAILSLKRLLYYIINTQFLECSRAIKILILLTVFVPFNAWLRLKTILSTHKSSLTTLILLSADIRKPTSQRHLALWLITGLKFIGIYCHLTTLHRRCINEC